MRIIVEGWGRKVIDLELMAPLRKAPPGPRIPEHDPHSTTYSQVEQASEPAPGFGFRGSTGTVVASMDEIRKREGL